MTVLEMKVDALVQIAMGTPRMKQKGKETLRMLMDGLIPAPVLADTVTQLLKELGFPEGSLGFELASRVLVLGYEQPRLLDGLYQGVFSTVGQERNLLPQRVERNIYTGIATMFRRGNSTQLLDFFDGCISDTTGIPSTGTFIRRCMRELRSRMEVRAC